MAYKYSQGNRKFGDIKFEGDTNTEIDFEDDYIALEAGGNPVLVASGSKVGVNEANPQYHLHIKADPETNSATSMIEANAGGDAFVYFGQAGVTTSFIKRGSGGNLVLTNQTSNGDIIFNIKDGSTTREGLRLNGDVAEVVINESSDSLVDFRVESNSNTHMLFIDGSEDKVGIDTSSPKTALDVHHNPTSLAYDTGGGEVVTFGSGTLTAGKLYFLNSSGVWTETDADAAATSDGLLGIALGSSPANDGVLLRGFFSAKTSLIGWTAGASVYISTTAARMTVTQPTGTGDIVRCIGYCTNTGPIIYFNPESTTLELG